MDILHPGMVSVRLSSLIVEVFSLGTSKDIRVIRNDILSQLQLACAVESPHSGCPPQVTKQPQMTSTSTSRSQLCGPVTTRCAPMWLSPLFLRVFSPGVTNMCRQQHSLTSLRGSSAIESPDREGRFSGSRRYDSCVIELPDREGMFSGSQEKSS